MKLPPLVLSLVLVASACAADTAGADIYWIESFAGDRDRILKPVTTFTLIIGVKWCAASVTQ